MDNKIVVAATLTISLIIVVFLTGHILERPHDSDKSVSKENMVLIPAGTFLMGREDREGWSPMGAPELFDDELPAHQVYVDAFYIDKYEVTNRQFKDFVDSTGYTTDAEKDGGSMVMLPADQTDEPVKGTDIGWKWVEEAAWHAPEG
ncbi:MAG: formylglycine-generating enzyme family protein, partial [Candidatus Bathyarchaeota archaeon]|nr:formylglycine-generating enzyme family protein [Candidatus Bathyarchaeota archaeon]